MEKWVKLSRDMSCGLATLDGGRSISQMLEPNADTRGQQVNWMSSTSNIDPRIVSFIQNHSFNHDRYTYVIVAPLGADESWEQTINGDAFERKHLATVNPKFGHKTFETHGRAYMHHRNTDPMRSFGDFPCMFFNDAMDRCEGIWRLIHDDAPKVVGAQRTIDTYRSGKDFPISMGCKVPYDVCSICNNKAETPANYCDHVHDPGFGSIFPDGRKMRVMNPFPLFFDLSAVDTNAAPEATPLGWIFPELIAFLKTLSKTSGHTKASSASFRDVKRSHRIIVPSAYLAAYHDGVDSRSRKLTKASGLEPIKVSDMIKQIPAMATEVLTPLSKSEDNISPDKIEDIVKSSSSQIGCLSNLASLGIVLRPEEFRHMVMKFMPGNIVEEEWPSMAIDDIREGFKRGPRGMLNPESLRGHVISQIRSLAPARSILFPHMARRVVAVRNAPTALPPARPYKSAIQVTLDIKVPKELGVMYGQYIKELSTRMAEMVKQLLSRFPVLSDDLGVKEAGRIQNAVDALGPSASIKTSQLAAQALLPSAYMLKQAGSLNDEAALIESVDALNKPDTARFFGGVYGS